MPDSTPGTLTSCNEIPERGHTKTFNGRKTAKRTFLQIWNYSGGQVPTTKEVVEASGMPVIGEAHPEDSAMVCVKIGDPQEVDGDKYVYKVPVQYDSEPGGGGYIHYDDPEDDPWKVDIQTEQRPKVKERTITSATWLSETGPPKIVGMAAGTPCANSAGEPWDPPIQESNDLEIITLTYNRRTASVNAQTLGAYRNTMNSAAITIVGRTIPKWCGKMLNIGISGPNMRSNTGFYTITFRIGVIVCGTTSAGYPQETWAHMMADVGYSYLNGTDLLPIKLKGGALPRRPFPLNGTGGFSLTQNIPNVWLVFATLTDAAWSGLNLPATLPDWDDSP